MFNQGALQKESRTRPPQGDPYYPPAEDLCTLALLAESNELHSSSSKQQGSGEENALSQGSLGRLENLAGARPQGYWSELLRCALALDLMSCNAQRWSVTNHNAEILGATQSECFPALMAVWLSQPKWLGELLELSGLELSTKHSSPNLSMALLQFLGVFEPDAWYSVSSMEVMVESVMAHLGHHQVDEVREVLTELLLTRAFGVLGCCEFNAKTSSFRVLSQLSLPPISRLDASLRDAIQDKISLRSRAEAYRTLIARKLSENTAWTQVNEQLVKFQEARRDRNASDSCIMLRVDHLQIATSPKIPFRDCLYLARFGRLVAHQKKQRGCYTFELNRATLKHKALDEFSGFLSERCNNTEAASIVCDLMKAASKP